MGNSLGSFNEYWRLYRKYPNLQGGFIWDFVDQGIRWKGKNGKTIYAYGGDFNRFDVSYNNFCCNGLFSPDRRPNPHAYEVGYYYQNIWSELADLDKGEIYVYNENFFRDLSAYSLEWALLADGHIMRQGRIEQLNIKPQQKSKLTLPIGSTDTDKEWLLNLTYRLKENEGVLPTGHIVAHQQLALNTYVPHTATLTNVKESNRLVIVPQLIDNQKNYLIIQGEDFTVEFSRTNGFLSRYVVNSKSFLKKGAQLTPNFWRAPTDNDFGAGLQKRWAVWKNPTLKLTDLKAYSEDDKMIVSADYEIKDIAGKFSLIYRINNQGVIEVTQKLIADKDAKNIPPMFRFGMQMAMPRNYETVEYYGRGPIENYSDRHDAMHIGIYRQSVDEQFYPYIRPQENGTRTDIRWWKMLDETSCGLQITANAPFSASALHYTIESLDDGDEKDQRHSMEVEEADLTNLCIDKAQMGLQGENSWGSLPLPQFQLPYGDYEFTFRLVPIKHCF